MAVAFAFHVAGRLPAARPHPLVVEDLGTGAAGAGLPHHPEVALLAHADDALRRHAHLLVPDLEGLVVVRVDRDPELLLGQSHDVGEILPGPGDRLFLEVIAEGEVSQHLEEGMVAGRHPDVFQIVVLSPGPDALLGGGRAPVAPVLQTEETVLELDHPGIREKERRVVLRNQGRARDPRVGFSLEKFQKTLPDLTPRHRHETLPPPFLLAFYKSGPWEIPFPAGVLPIWPFPSHPSRRSPPHRNACRGDDRPPPPG